MESHEPGRYVELAFSFDDDAYPAIRISRALGCRLELLDAVRSTDGLTTAFFHVMGDSVDRILAHGRGASVAEDVELLDRFDGECLVEITLSDTVFGAIADAGVPLRSLVVTDGAAELVVTVPPGRSPERLVSAVTEQYPSIELAGKRRTDLAPPFAPRTALQSVLDERLTARQLEALSLAHEDGYFDRPRGATQRELAAAMHISASTYGQHLHTALRKLLGALFADGLRGDGPDDGGDGDA